MKPHHPTEISENDWNVPEFQIALEGMFHVYKSYFSMKVEAKFESTIKHLVTENYDGRSFFRVGKGDCL